MKVGEWAVFKHTTVIGTGIFPQPRLIEDFNEDVVYFDTKEFPRSIDAGKMIGTFPTIYKARDAIEVGLTAWAAGEEEIMKLERKIERARRKRLDAVVAVILEGSSIDA